MNIHKIPGEVYSVDFSPDGKAMVFCGCNDSWSAIELDTMDLLCTGEGYSDSLIFVRFISDDVIIFAVMDGYIYKNNIKSGGGELASACAGGDITFIDIEGDCIRVGLASGELFFYDFDLNIKLVLMGRPSEVLSICSAKGVIYVSYSDCVMRFDKYGACREVIRGKECGILHFVDAYNIVCVDIDGSLVFICEDRVVKRIERDGKVECIYQLNNLLVVGGNFRYLMIVDVAADFLLSKVNLIDEVSGVTFIRSADGCGLICSTCDGGICTVDLNRDICRYFRLRVGTVFDFSISGELVLFGGEFGIDMVSIGDLSDS